MRRLAALVWLLAAANSLPADESGPSGGGPSETLVLPGAANTIGTHASRWRSDLTLKNPGPEPVEVRVFFLKAGAANDLASAPRHDYFLISGESRDVRNVLGSDFGIAGTGALLVTVAQQIFPNNPAGAGVTASLRTATSVHFANGEAGPPIPAAEPTEAERQIVAPLRHDGVGEKGVRGAVGIVNLSRTQGISVRVEVLDETGEVLGSQGLHAGALSVSQQPLSVRFSTGRVRFTRVDGSRAFVAYGTTVDNASEESTFLYALPEPGRPAPPLRLSFGNLVERPAPLEPAR